MDKVEHGRRLAAAMKAKGYNRQTVADAAQVKPRTVTNWTSGQTLPQKPSEWAALHALFGDYDSGGDPVEVAVRGSSLTEDRQLHVLSVYKRELREQDDEMAARAVGGSA